MKIGLVLDDGLDSVDGVQQYVLTLGSWLELQGHEVHYIVGQTKRTDIRNVHSLAKNIQVRFNKNRLAIPIYASKTKISKLLKQEQFDVLHVQMPYSPQYGGRIVSLAPESTVVVGTFHILPYGRLQSFSSRLLAVTYRKTMHKFTKVVSVSPAAQSFAKNVMSIESDVLPNAVNLTKFNKGVPLQEYADGKQNIVFLGRLVERKGCLELLKAVELLVKTKRFSNRRLILCGTGPLESSIKKYIAHSNLASYVDCVGRISEAQKPHYLASADLAIFPSKSGESFGIVLVEAIASGAGVVVGGDNPGYTYVLSGCKDVLINPRNIIDFSEKIDTLLNDEVRSRALGAKQKEDIKKFDVSVVGTQLVGIYDASIAKAAHNHNNT